MDNRPARIKKNIIAFRDSPWDAKFNFPAGYDQTGLAAYLKVGRQLLDVEVGVSTSGDQFTPSLTAEQVSYLPNAVDLYIANEGVAIIAGTINVRMGGDDDDGDDGNEFEVQIGGDEIVVVEILGMDLIAGQVETATEAAETATTKADIATTKASEASASAEAASSSEGAAATSASNASVSAASAATSEINAAASAASAEAILAQKLDFFSVNTYAALQAFIADPEVGPCAILVFFDETYGGLPRLHVYTGDIPVVGPDLIQFVTYTV